MFFLKNMGQSRPLLNLFSWLSHSNHNFNNMNWKNCKCFAWDSNTGRWIIGADETTELSHQCFSAIWADNDS